jgi:hypothetical protein
MEFIKKYKLEDFDNFKTKMELMIEMMKEEYDCSYARMTYSDYKLPWSSSGGKPPYYDVVVEKVKPYLDEYAKGWGCRSVHIENLWFAEYYDGGEFGWHTHEGSNMSCVVQLHLDNKNHATQLMGYDNLDLEEGDLLVFPAMVPHRSPEVNYDRKLVIAVNFNIVGSVLNALGE